MTTPNSCSPSPEGSTPAPDLSKKYSPRGRLFLLATQAKMTAGILTPIETLELVDLAEHWYWKYVDRCVELEQALWDLEHPKHKDV